MRIFSRLPLVALAALPVFAQAMQGIQTAQREPGIVHGTVIRTGTGDPISGATLTLSVEPPASLIDSIKSFASSMGIPSAEAQGVVTELMTATPEFLAREIEGAKADGGAPATFVAILSQALTLKTETKGFPLRGPGNLTSTRPHRSCCSC